MKTLHIVQILKVIFFYLLMTIPFLALVLSAQAQTSSYGSILEESFGEHQSGATALVAKNGKILFHQAIGKANIELGVEMKTDHVFRIGSITKEFTAVAILQLQEKGKLDIKDPIHKYLPDYPKQGKGITIEHLLTHTSGIKRYDGMAEVEHLQHTAVTPMQIIKVFKDAPLEAEPGEQYQYNNYGYILLGAIIEEVSGMSYAAYLEQNIFKPALLKNTYFGEELAPAQDRATGYQRQDGRYAKAPYLNMAIPYAAGALLSNIDDLYTWTKALQNHQLLSEESLAKAFSAYQLKNGSQTPYGYGWQLSEMYNRKVVGHDGVIQGFLSYALYLPEEDLFVAVLSNCTCKNPVDATNKLTALALGEFPVLQKEGKDPSQVDQYLGAYQFEEGIRQEIFREDHQLYSLSTGDRRRPIYRSNEDQFFFEDGLNSIQFIRNEAGTVIGLERLDKGHVLATAKRTSQSVVKQAAIQLKEEELQEYVGKYDLGPFHLFITLEEDKLFGQPEGQSKEELFAKAKDHLFLKTVDAEMEFFRKDGLVQAVRVTIGNNSFEGKLVQE